MAGAGSDNFEPLDVVSSVATAPADQLSAWKSSGTAAIAAGHVAALTLAGGQGTRLGFDRPKGEYDVGLPSHRCLFELEAARLRRLAAVAGSATPLAWYVMTSPATHADTLSAFESNNYYGYPKDAVMFFQQGTLPCMSVDGKVLLETGSRIAMAPDGNGGIYRALHVSGALADMQRRGVQWLHAFAVDNALVLPCDPTFVGACIEAGAQVGAKAACKTDPAEKVGVLCRRNGKYAVVEYSDMDDATKAQRNEDGSLVYSSGNLCIHMYSVEWLATAAHPDALPKEYHVAHKAIPVADPETGETIPKSSIEGNNGVKLESFIFDIFPRADTMAVLEIERACEFAPVKNAPGKPSDTPEAARAALLAEHGRWLAAAGATAGVNGAGHAAVEISGDLSYSGENLGALAGMTLQSPGFVGVASDALVRELPADAEAVNDRVKHGVVNGVHVYSVA